MIRCGLSPAEGTVGAIAASASWSSNSPLDDNRAMLVDADRIAAKGYVAFSITSGGSLACVHTISKSCLDSRRKPGHCARRLQRCRSRQIVRRKIPARKPNGNCRTAWRPTFWRRCLAFLRSDLAKTTRQTLSARSATAGPPIGERQPSLGFQVLGSISHCAADNVLDLGQL